jgi:putative PEP-CTERM system histidine kinase
MTTSILLHAGCAALYLLLTAIILLGPRRDRTCYALAASCLMTVIWAAGVAVGAALFAGGQADQLGPRILELGQQAAWYGFALHLYGRAVPDGSALVAVLRRLGLLAIVMVAVSIATTTPAAVRAGLGVDPLAAFGIDARLGLAICTLLLIENLYRNTSEDLRWHVALPCVALGGLFVYDIVLYSDAALFRRTSAALFDGRPVVTALLTPLLAIFAQRNRRRWGELPPARTGRRVASRTTAASIKVSHTAVFYSASLVVTGVFLVALALTGEVARAFFPGSSAGWGALLEVSLISGGVLAVAVLVTSGSARSSLRNLVIKNFLTHRYDYRIEWLRCIETLSQTNSHVALHTRVIKAVAQTVDSPAGMAFLREPIASNAFQWAGSWNLPTSPHIFAADHPALAAFGDGTRVVEGAEAAAFVSYSGLEALAEAAGQPNDVGHEIWLAVPLRHQGQMLGFILLSRPRAPFLLDQEVFELLRIVGQEVASYINEQRATEALLQAQQLREYGQRFAFVAHDIKNVASQLSLLMANSEHHISNPAFQHDMLATIAGSVQKITTLLARLKAPSHDKLPAITFSASRRLPTLLAALPPDRRARIAIQDLLPSGQGLIQMASAAFDSVITHLLDNAFDASGEHDTVRIVFQVTSRAGAAGHHHHLLIDIIDQGVGMTAEFIRHELFRPFRTSKLEGFGIGVYQARELLREAAGDLVVTSAPGRGTTMRLALPLVAEPARAVVEAAE